MPTSIIKCRVCGSTEHKHRVQTAMRYGEGFIKAGITVWLKGPDSDLKWLCKIVRIDACPDGNGKCVVMECIEPGENFGRMFETRNKSCIFVPKRKSEHKCWESFKKTQRR